MSRHEHPSDRLSSGAVRDFAEALDVVRQQFAYERFQARAADELGRALARWDTDHAEVRAALRHAQRVYEEEQERARLRTVERLLEDAHAAEAALDDEAALWLRLLAAALQERDYRRLAI